VFYVVSKLALFSLASMKIFLSYASEDRETAKAIYLALRDQGHRVFFDRADLPAGDEFHNRIRRAIEGAHLFIFLFSAKAIDARSYTLSELEIAQNSRVKLLPVALDQLDFAAIPASLKAVTIYQTEGNLAASVSAEVCRIAADFRRKRVQQGVVAMAILVALSGGLYYALRSRENLGFTGKDGAPMVLVPAGTFVMGDDQESPRREIYLDAFYMDKFEITLSRFAQFLKAHGSLRPPDDWPERDPSAVADLPVVGVDWHDAEAYCRWAGKRLPTEAEWEKAARGSDERKYPWGNDEPRGDRARFERPYQNPVYRDDVSPVGKYTKGMSPFGVDDLAGNAAEWVNDWYAESFPSAETRNPRGAETGKEKVLRGGGWYDPAARITATKRMHAGPDHRDDATGFRCAADRS